MTEEVFVVPPGWPRPPEGWVPPADWRPDPSWPPAPAGWRFWQDPAPPVAQEPAPLTGGPSRTGSVAADQGRELGRLRRENAALRAEIRRLESAVEASNGELHRLLGADPALVRAETERMLRDWGTAETQLRSTLAQLEAAQRQPAAGGADFGR